MRGVCWQRGWTRWRGWGAGSGSRGGWLGRARRGHRWLRIGGVVFLEGWGALCVFVARVCDLEAGEGGLNGWLAGDYLVLLLLRGARRRF